MRHGKLVAEISSANLNNKRTRIGRPGQAVAKPRTTGISALLFSGPSRREGEKGEFGIARLECSRTYRQ
jgi:hypothetical protein